MMSLRTFARTLLRRVGWELRPIDYCGSDELMLERFLRAARPDTVFDIGANEGQYAISLRKCGFHGRIVSFEAIPSVHAVLSAAAAKDPDWVVAPCCALGRAAGEARINLARNSVSSSLLPMNDAHVKAAPGSKYIGVETVRMARLDEIARPLLPSAGRLLLKIDTQGYEEEVLAGSESILEGVSAIQLEMSLLPLYQGAPSFRRVLELCESLGFELHGLIPGFYESKTNRLLQADGLFLKTGTP
jgi:FkbM family methyltransferase